MSIIYKIDCNPYILQEKHVIIVKFIAYVIMVDMTKNMHKNQERT